MDESDARDVKLFAARVGSALLLAPVGAAASVLGIIALTLWFCLVTEGGAPSPGSSNVEPPSSTRVIVVGVAAGLALVLGLFIDGMYGLLVAGAIAGGVFGAVFGFLNPLVETGEPRSGRSTPSSRE